MTVHWSVPFSSKRKSCIKSVFHRLHGSKDLRTDRKCPFCNQNGIFHSKHVLNLTISAETLWILGHSNHVGHNTGGNYLVRHFDNTSLCIWRPNFDLNHIELHNAKFNPYPWVLGPWPSVISEKKIQSTETYTNLLNAALWIFFPENTLGDGPAFWIFFPRFTDKG